MKNDLGEGEGEAASGALSAAESAFLKKMKFQLSVAPILLQWICGRLEKVSQSRLHALQEAIQTYGMDSLDPLRQKYLKDEKLRHAVMHSA